MVAPHCDRADEVHNVKLFAVVLNLVSNLNDSLGVLSSCKALYHTEHRES